MPPGSFLFSALSKLISSPLYGSSYRLLQVAALLIVIRAHPNFEVISATKNKLANKLHIAFDGALNKDHTILVGAPIVLNPPTKAADL
jgi:hypothetical protein